MADALVMLVDTAQHVATREGHMARVEQQRDGGGRHEGVKLRLRLHHRRHVVVIDQRHALRLDPAREVGHLRPIVLHLSL